MASLSAECGMAVMSIRGVKMSPASSSPNSMALLIRSDSSLSISPSSSASSMMEISSSSVMPLSSSPPISFTSRIWSFLSRKVRGANTVRKAWIMGAEKHANFSGEFFAMVLGEISPNRRMTTVSAAVETVAATSALAMSSVNIRVAIAAASMFTILLPISMVEMRVS